uniref:Uncharacterized protein n=1 Tax=Ditylenchus dipsaci TaxID=166011 RepID=A0A915EM97_9BILA
MTMDHFTCHTAYFPQPPPQPPPPPPQGGGHGVGMEEGMAKSGQQPPPPPPPDGSKKAWEKTMLKTSMKKCRSFMLRKLEKSDLSLPSSTLYTHDQLNQAG